MFDFDKHFLRLELPNSRLTQLTLAPVVPDNDAFVATEITVRTVDKIEEVENTDEIAVFKVQRIVDFSPATLFRIEATFVYVLLYNPETYNDVDWKEVNLIQEIKEQSSKLLSPITARASLLVSKLTAATNLVPIITPPNFLAE